MKIKRKWITAIAIILIGLFALFSLAIAPFGKYELEANEVAVIATKDKIHEIVSEPGQHWVYPLIKSPFVYYLGEYASDNYLERMLTNDKHFVYVDYRFYWKMTDPAKYHVIYGGGYPEDSLFVERFYASFIQRVLIESLTNYEVSDFGPLTGYQGAENAEVEKTIFETLNQQMLEARKRLSLHTDSVVVTEIELKFSFDPGQYNAK